jgi:hypothetical protein
MLPQGGGGGSVLVAVSQQGRGRLVSSKVVDRLVRIRPCLSETRRANIDTAIRALRPKAAPPLHRYGATKHSCSWTVSLGAIPPDMARPPTAAVTPSTYRRDSRN